jgi:hypothetical protein
LANLTKTITNRIGVAKSFLGSGWDVDSWDAGTWDDAPDTSDIPEIDVAFYKLISNAINIEDVFYLSGVKVYVLNTVTLSGSIYRSIYKLISNSIGISVAIDRQLHYRRTLSDSIGLSTSDISARFVNGIWILVLPDSTTNAIDRFTPVYTSMAVSATVWSEI